MATVPQTQPQPQLNPQPALQPHLIHNLEKKPVQIIPTKLAIFGEQGTGKTTTACLYAAWLSKEFHGGAPIWGTDPELGMQFPKRTIFTPEKIDFQIRTVPTFQGMMTDLRDAERAGACVWMVELQKIWIELLKTVRKKSPNNWGNELNAMWTDYVAHFLNSKLHCIALGRVGDVTDDLIEDGKIVKVKTGEKMKAGGSNNFGYEPHLVLRMKFEIKPRRRAGQLIEHDGRMFHIAYVLKDRTWALNGMEFRWSDKTGYKVGGYAQVAQSLRPHFAAVQETTDAPTLDTTANSEAMIDVDGNSEYYAKRQRRDVTSAEIKGCLDLFFAGQGKEEKQLRLAVNDLIFGVKSKEAADALPFEKLERGLRILHAYEKIPCKKMDSPQAVLTEMTACIAEYDRGESEEWEIPF
jgi:DNA polymerase III delta prime subunit